MTTPKKMSLTLRVRNYQVDAYGHVNNAKYVVFLEEARTVFLEKMGYTLSALMEDEIQILITNVTVNYKSPAKLDDELTIYSWIGKIASRSLTWSHEIFQKDTDKLVLQGSVTAVFFRRDKIISIPAQIKQTLLKFGFESNSD